MSNNFQKILQVTVVIFILIVTAETVTAGDLSGKIICIDPGHGGSDPGATWKNLEEEDVNLDVALRLKDLLISNGAVPILTRETDINPTHTERWRIAQDNYCDLFIAIHVNSVESTTAKGTEVYYYPCKDDAKVLATQVYGEVISDLDSKGYRANPIKCAPGTRSYTVLGASQYNMRQVPAINVELGFIRNPDEYQMLLTSEYRAEAANAILNGLKVYYGDLPKYSPSVSNVPVTLSISPNSGKQGTVFSFSGNGYTPNGDIEWHVRKPDNSKYPTSILTASSSGILGYTYTSNSGSMIGTYTIWAVDKATGRKSNEVTETIISVNVPEPITPVTSDVTLSISPDSGPQGTTFRFTGSGYTPNGVIEWYVLRPDKTQSLGKFTATGSGELIKIHESTSKNAPGTYTVWAVDKATGRKSNEVTETIT